MIHKIDQLFNVRRSMLCEKKRKTGHWEQEVWEMRVEIFDQVAEGNPIKATAEQRPSIQ